jgi:hypothetical protein
MTIRDSPRNIEQPKQFTYDQHIHNHYTQEIQQQKALTNTLNSAINTYKGVIFAGGRHHEHSHWCYDTLPE